jgi:hypothetical protein
MIKTAIITANHKSPLVRFINRNRIFSPGLNNGSELMSGVKIGKIICRRFKFNGIGSIPGLKISEI